MSGRIGMLNSMSCESVLSTELEATSTIGDSPTTSTVSVTPPIPRVRGIEETPPIRTSTLSWRRGRKPESSADTE